MRNRRSPLIEHTQSFHATSRSPVRRARRSLSSPSTNTSTSMSVSGCSPSARGHHRRGRSTSSDQSISLTPAASGCSVSPTTAPSRGRAHAHRAGDVAVEPGVQAQVGAGVVGVAAQHAQPLELHRSGVVDEHRPPETARVPVPGDGLGVLEQPGDVAPAARAALRVAGHLDGQDVVVAEAGQRGDVEAVREEVALRVAEVGAVEPHVGLVEDAVERHPAALARRPVVRARSGGGRGSARRSWRTSGSIASGRGRRSRATSSRRRRGRCRRGGARRRRRGPATGRTAPRRGRLPMGEPRIPRPTDLAVGSTLGRGGFGAPRPRADHQRGRAQQLRRRRHGFVRRSRSGRRAAA